MIFRTTKRYTLLLVQFHVTCGNGCYSLNQFYHVLSGYAYVWYMHLPHICVCIEGGYIAVESEKSTRWIAWQFWLTYSLAGFATEYQAVSSWADRRMSARNVGLLVADGSSCNYHTPYNTNNNNNNNIIIRTPHAHSVSSSLHLSRRSMVLWLTSRYLRIKMEFMLAYCWCES